jgi:TolB-like protein/Flp pilus assembly protein TadD
LSVPTAALTEALSGRYTLERELGRGGMATVYLAHDLRHDRPVALKVLHPHLAATLGPERFLREIKLAARLQHPHILSVHDSGEAAGQLWFTMPFVEGESLRDRLTRERQLPVEDALRITTEAARALDYAHQHGVIHRDIKPENLLLTRDGSTLVADFGIARALTAAGEERLTETGIAVGSPAYMSPEQAAGERQLDARTDVYSLGSVLYEMLAGEAPFTGPTARAISAKRLSGEVPRVRLLRPGVPEAVEQALQKALALVPADRFATTDRFAHALAMVPVTSPASTMTAVSSRAAATPPLTARRRVPLLALTLGLGVLIGLAVLFASRRTQTGAEGTPSGGSALPRSIAVLPLANLSRDSASEYFGDGISEEILNALAQLPDLRVAARTSAFQFRGKDIDLREVGRRLDVTTVLEGSIQRSGDAVRITVQLIDARTGYHLWSGRFDRPMVHLFAVEDEISRAIADTLRLPLGLGGRGPASVTNNPTAHDFYLRGLGLIAQRGTALQPAIAYFDSALAYDSNFAPAWSGLAQAYELTIWGKTQSVWRTTLPRAERAARRALVLDSVSASAHAALGNIHRDRKQWAEADREYRRALQLRPDDPEIMDQYAQFLAQTGQLEGARRWLGRAIRLNPLAPTPPMVLGRLLLAQHQYDSAIAMLHRSVQLRSGGGPARAWLVLAYLFERRYTEAEAEARAAADQDGTDPETYAALVRAVADPSQRTWALKSLATVPDSVAGDLVQPARELWLAMLGDTEGALQVLNQWADVGWGDAAFLWLPPLDPMRADPRFRAVLSRFKLPYRGEVLP